MIQKILPLSIFVLILVLILIAVLQFLLGKKNPQVIISVTPTVFQGRDGNTYNPQPDKTNPNKGGNIPVPTITQQDLRKQLPIKKAGFTLDYSERMQKYVVSLENENGELAYDQWLEMNQSYAPFLGAGDVIVAQQSMQELHGALDYAQEKKNKSTPEEEFRNTTDALLSIIGVLFSPITGPTDPIVIPTLTPTPLPTPTAAPITPPPSPIVPSQAVEPSPPISGGGGYVYYSQCSSVFGQNPLPNGCTICKAGCGPTTAAMILSSFIDPTLTPPKVIAAMDRAGLDIGCYGSYISQIYPYMSRVPGLKVSSLMPLSRASAKQVAGDFRNYINAGWTIFALAEHKYGGHYFWITNVTSDGRILAYDPAYGTGRPAPFDENQYAPYPLYKWAFAIKKL